MRGSAMLLHKTTPKRRAWLTFLGACALALLAMPASAQVEVQIFPNPTVFEVSPAFSHDNDAHRNISGAACTAISTHAGCVAVNDVSNFAQSFSLSGNRIAAGTIIPLQPQRIDDLTFASVGAEGAAFD